MSEYNIQMNKYNALNDKYDQLYPATKIKNVDGLDTALQNKAPAGFGLGTVATFLTDAYDLNTIGKGGWYWWTSLVPKNAPNIAGCTMRVDPGELETGSYATQTIYFIGQNKGAKLRRYNVDGTWYPWEWENPPMFIGDEYRTTERYNGKPVYTMAVDLGVSVNGNKSVDVPVGANCFPIRCSGYVGNAYCIPYSEDNVSTNRIWLNASPTATGINLSLWCGSTFAGMHGYAQVWYTKYAD